MASLSKGSTALITGAGNGIGLAVASMLSARGVSLALVDNNADYLKRAKEQLTSSSGGVEVETYEMDVSRPEQWQDLKTKIASRFGQEAPQFLMLNAGIGRKGAWGNGDYFREIMDVNLFGQINGLNTFVPVMQESGMPGTIVMTGSKQGITNPPGNAAYNASKAAVKSLAEHLHYDLRSTPLNVHLLVPGWTFTGLSGNLPGGSKQKPDGAWKPEQVGEYLFERLGRGKEGFWVICPDNDVTEEKDRKRMLWTAGDAVYGRPPMSRWREETKEEAEKWMQDLKL